MLSEETKKKRRYKEVSTDSSSDGCYNCKTSLILVNDESFTTGFIKCKSCLVNFCRNCFVRSTKSDLLVNAVGNSLVKAECTLNVFEEEEDKTLFEFPHARISEMQQAECISFGENDSFNNTHKTELAKVWRNDDECLNKYKTTPTRMRNKAGFLSFAKLKRTISERNYTISQEFYSKKMEITQDCNEQNLQCHFDQLRRDDLERGQYCKLQRPNNNMSDINEPNGFSHHFSPSTSAGNEILYSNPMPIFLGNHFKRRFSMTVADSSSSVAFNSLSSIHKRQLTVPSCKYYRNHKTPLLCDNIAAKCTPPPISQSFKFLFWNLLLVLSAVISRKSNIFY